MDMQLMARDETARTETFVMQRRNEVFKNIPVPMLSMLSVSSIPIKIRIEHPFFTDVVGARIL
jgi:hypothetical protein